MNSFLFNISPIDGRYYSKTKDLFEYFSEWALFKYRIKVEIEWLIFFTDNIKTEFKLDNDQKKSLKLIYENFNVDDGLRIKEIEKVTNHDVKACEYFIRDKLDLLQVGYIKEFVHIFCTSEDINNLAYNLMIKDALNKIYLPILKEVYFNIYKLGIKYKDIVILSRTHGQPAVPSTIGKELINFVARLKDYMSVINSYPLKGKFNGAVGNFNSHYYSLPALDWKSVSENFVKSLGLVPNLYTTQIEPHDSWANLFFYISQINNILSDFAKDIWTYISFDYFKQRKKENEVGSSTMPHKVNPIDFENAEGNLAIANSLAMGIANKLQISRLQRDLSDSTVERNMGLIFAYSVLAYKSLLKGMGKLEINKEKIKEDIDNNYQILGEAIQSVLRLHNYDNPYDILKKATRGAKITKDNYFEFIEGLDISDDLKKHFKKLTPEQYCGIAQELIDSFNPDF